MACRRVVPDLLCAFTKSAHLTGQLIPGTEDRYQNAIDSSGLKLVNRIFECAWFGEDGNDLAHCIVHRAFRMLLFIHRRSLLVSGARTRPGGGNCRARRNRWPASSAAGGPRRLQDRGGPRLEPNRSPMSTALRAAEGW